MTHAASALTVTQAASVVGLVAAGAVTGGLDSALWPALIAVSLASAVLAMDLLTADAGVGDDWTPFIAVSLTLFGAVAAACVAAGALIRLRGRRWRRRTSGA